MPVSEAQKEGSKRWYHKHKEEVKLKRNGNRHEENKIYYQKNKEKLDKKNKSWAKNNPEKAKEILRKSRMRNPEKRLFNAAKNRAIRKGIDFNIELKDIVIPNKCPYLNVEFIYGDYDKSLSLDRIDSTKGYIKGNIQVISVKANRMKNTATKEELIIFAKYILNSVDV